MADSFLVAYPCLRSYFNLLPKKENCARRHCKPQSCPYTRYIAGDTEAEAYNNYLVGEVKTPP